MSENIREYLTHRRRDENGDNIWPKSVMDGQYVMKYAIRRGGDVDQQIEWARQWVAHVCKNPDKEIPDHIMLYSMGGVLSAACPDSCRRSEPSPKNNTFVERVNAHE